LDELAEQFAAAFKQAAAKRTLPLLGQSAVGLSGGLDSRTVLCACLNRQDVLAFSLYDEETPEFRIARSIAGTLSAPDPMPSRPLTQPATQWNYATNAHVIADDGATRTVSFVDPSVPAYFTLRFDAASLRPRVLHMTAAAHFMTDRYESFNSPRAIYPPR